MKRGIIYIHGKGGVVSEVEYYKKLLSKDYEIIGFDYSSEFPWEAKEEFPEFFDSIMPQYSEIYILANSIGAYYAMTSLGNKPIKKAMFISPIVDMERLILNMMLCSNVSEEELFKIKKIETKFGETLSWDYLSYVRNNPIIWKVPTKILYGANDNMTSLKTMIDFANRSNANLSIMENGEHWFHTEEQMIFLGNWFKENI